jgi:DNA-binding transcriptional LysR family regulator
LSDLELQVFASPLYLARRGVPRTAQETADHEWVLLRQLPHPASLPEPKVAPRVVGDDMLFLQQAVKAGLGLGLLTTFIAQEDLAAGRLVRVLPRLAFRLGAVYLVHPPAQHVPRKVAAFRDYLLEYLAVHPIVGKPEG